MVFSLQKQDLQRAASLFAALILSFPAECQPVSPLPPVVGDVFQQYRLAKFEGSGTDTIEAVAADADGNIIVAGRTTSPDLPMKNSAQPAIGGAQVMRSTNRGNSWTPLGNLPSGDPITIQPHPYSPDVLFAGARDGIYKSADAGKRWRKIFDQGPPPQSVVFRIVIDPGDPQRMYAVGSAIFGSIDGGESWTTLQQDAVNQLQIDPNGSGALLASTAGVGGKLILSRDRGLTWTMISASPDLAVFVPQHTGWIYRLEQIFSSPGAWSGRCGNFHHHWWAAGPWGLPNGRGSASGCMLLAEPRPLGSDIPAHSGVNHNSTFRRNPRARSGCLSFGSFFGGCSFFEGCGVFEV